MALKYLDRIIDQELSKSIEIWSVRRKQNEEKQDIQYRLYKRHEKYKKQFNRYGYNQPPL